MDKQPRRETSRLAYWIGRLWMRAFGWTVEGSLPASGSFVVIAAPHTSNWDLPHTLAATYIFRLKLYWLGKDSLFKWPFGGFMRWLGGIPIKRDSKSGFVKQAAALLHQERAIALMVPPSGTRGRAKYWKTGFYWIANEAQVPIVCGSVDYKRRVAWLGEAFVPTGDPATDMDHIRNAYKDVTAKFPENTTRIRLPIEDEGSEPAIAGASADDKEGAETA